MARRAWLLAAAALVLTLLAAAFVPAHGSFALHVLAQACVAALACLSLNVLLGEAGLPSFGHALYTGTGAVLAMHALRWLHAGSGAHALAIALVPLVAAAGALLLAVPLAWLCARRTGTAFAMLTLALGELAWAAALMADGIFGGEAGISASRMAARPFLGLDWGSEGQIAALIAVYTLAGAAAMDALRRTRFGLLLRACRENAERVAALGASPQRVRALAYMQAAFFAALAGALGALLMESANASLLDGAHSGALLLFTLLGGSGAFWGPAVGGALMAVCQTALAAFTSAWPLAIGLLFIGMMLWAPGGVVELVQKLFPRPRGRAAPAEKPENAPESPGDESAFPALPLRLENLHYRAGGRVILENISLAIPAGETLAIIGANGAGKSTLFDLIGGQKTPSAGAIWLGGQRIDALSPPPRRRLGLARSFQQSRLFARLSVLDNLRAALLAAGCAPCDVLPRAHQLAAQLGLADALHTPAAALPYAAQRALELGLALAGGAGVLLLDEPTAGMDAQQAQHFAALVQRLAAGRTLLVIEHDVDTAFALAQRVAVLDGGRLIALGTPDEVRASAAVQHAYLGVEKEEHAAAPPADAAPPLLEVRGLRAWHGSVQALHGVDFDVHAGEIVALLGRQGSGRSTCARALMGLLPAQGSVRWRGQEIGGFAPWRIARLGLGWVPENRAVFGQLTVEQNLLLGQKPAGSAPPWSAEDLFALFPQLAARRRALAGTLSGGEQQMLALCRTLMGAPALLIVDEPCEGLAPQLVQQVAQCLRALQAHGCAVLLIDQRLAPLVATRALLMERGRITRTLTQGEMQEYCAIAGNISR